MYLTGNTRGNKAYIDCIKQKLNLGESNGVNAFKKILVKNGDGETIFILTSEVTRPSSRFLQVTEPRPNEYFIKLIGADAAVYQPQAQDLLEDPLLDVINEFAADNDNEFRFDPHRFPQGK